MKVWPVYGALIMMGFGLMTSLLGCAGANVLSAQRRYGPSTPGGYYVRVDPATIHMTHNQPAPLTVTVEDAAGQPVDDVLVHFTPSQGQLATASNLTQNGVVTATYTAPSGGDATHSAFVIVKVDDVEVTVFVDIVPAVFGR